MLTTPNGSHIHLLSPSSPKLDVSSLLSGSNPIDQQLNNSAINNRTRNFTPSVHQLSNSILNTSSTAVYRSSSSSGSSQPKKIMQSPPCLPPKLNLDFKLTNVSTPKTNSNSIHTAPSNSNYTLTNMHFEIPHYSPITLGGKQNSATFLSEAANNGLSYKQQEEEEDKPKKAKMRKNYSLGNMGSNNTSTSRNSLKDGPVSPYSQLSIDITTPSSRPKNICTDRVTPSNRTPLSPNAFQPFKSPVNSQSANTIKVADALSHSNRQNSKPKLLSDVPVMVVSIPQNTYSVYNPNKSEDSFDNKPLNYSAYQGGAPQLNVSNSKLQGYASQRNGGALNDSSVSQQSLRQTPKNMPQPPRSSSQSGFRSTKQEQQTPSASILIRSKKEMVDNYSESSSNLMKQIQASLDNLNRKELEIHRFLEDQQKSVDKTISNCVDTLLSLKLQSGGFFASLMQAVSLEYKEAREICECSLDHLQATHSDIQSNYSSILHEFDHHQVSQVIGAYSLRSNEVSQFLDQINAKEIKDLVFRFDPNEPITITFDTFTAQINALLNNSLKKFKTAFLKPFEISVSPPSKRKPVSQHPVTPPTAATTTLKKTSTASSQLKLSYVSPTHRKNNSASSNSSQSMQRYKTPTALQFNKEEFTPTASRAVFNNNDSSFFLNLESSFTTAQQDSNKSEKLADPIRRADSIDPLRLRIPLEALGNADNQSISEPSGMNALPMMRSSNSVEPSNQASQLRLNLSPQLEQLKLPAGLPRAPVKNLERQVKSVQQSTQIAPKSIYISFDNKDAFQRMESNSKMGKKQAAEAPVVIEEDILGTFRNLQVAEKQEVMMISDQNSKNQVNNMTALNGDEMMFQSAEKRSKKHLMESSEVCYESKENTPNFSNKKPTSLGESNGNAVVECRPYEFDFVAVEKTLMKLLKPEEQKQEQQQQQQVEEEVEEMAKQEKRSRENSLTKLQSYNEMLRIVQQNQINRTQNCESILRRVSESTLPVNNEISSTTSSTTTCIPSIHYRSDSAGGNAPAIFQRSSFTLPQSSGRIQLQESQSGVAVLGKKSHGLADVDDSSSNININNNISSSSSSNHFYSQRLSFEAESQMVLCSNQALKVINSEERLSGGAENNNSSSYNPRFFSQRYSPIIEENEHSSVNPLGTTQNSDVKQDAQVTAHNYQLFGSISEQY